MERFLSKSAQANAIAGYPAAAKHDAVVMFADLRNFSGSAETAAVEETARLVDRFVTVTTAAVSQGNGDVDKLLGDGVLAWFTGENAAGRAIQAAVQCIEGCRELQRRPGIGLFQGEVIAATLGKGDRLDFTILGRVVNLASRLCSVSAADEITVPTTFPDIQAAGLILAGQDEMAFKNHSVPIKISRYRVSV